jgi:hypothetical protein
MVELVFENGSYRDETPAEKTAREALAGSTPPSVESVTARQFKMQLAIMGIKAPVDAWVASQNELVQIAYEYSGTFVKSEPMMQSGFDALGFTNEQLEAFFFAASEL